MFIISYINLTVVSLLINLLCHGQALNNKQAWDQLNLIENSSTHHKLKRILNLKQQFEYNGLFKDSVYAKILHKAAVYLYYDRKQLSLAVEYTREAIQINISGKSGTSLKFAANSYANLAVFYKELMLPEKALIYFDSSILLARAYPDLHQSIIEAQVDKCLILLMQGDYQRYLEEAIFGQALSQKNSDTFHIIIFLNHQAQANLYQGNIIQALKDAEQALKFIKNNNLLDEKANSLKIKAQVNAQQRNISSAISMFKDAIKIRRMTGCDEKVADDYTDFGNFFLDEQNDFTNAKKCYFKTAEYAKKSDNKERLSKAHVSLGLVYFYQHNYLAAEQFYLKAFNDLRLNTKGKFLLTAQSSVLSGVANKDLILAMLNNKTELLLNLYKETNDKKYLEACLQTAYISDSVITLTRFQQSAEQSKLYWRNKTREFFSNAIEASYLAREPAKAFYFMEKSRAVLLNDKLKELAADNQLPLAETNKEQAFRIHIIEEQQKLESIQGSAEEYENQQEKLLLAKEKFERYIKSLEQKYPAYYQYKYNDKVPSLDSLQNFLATKKQTFVDYFIADTAAYILSITPSNTKFIKLHKNEFNSSQLLRFFRYCSNYDSLNNNYLSFISQSNVLYKLLFQPLQIPKGRTIICLDNFLIPFEALCTDTTGNNFLINDYIFSYVYSFSSNLEKSITHTPKGNFVGFAPVTFQSYMQVPELTESELSLKKCAEYYSNAKLFINATATRYNFLNSISSYNIINIFSHASADTLGKGSFLCMHDSTIKLFQLQMLRNCAAKLVVLGGCETSAGQNATGEGYYSLARAFSLANIPSVAATLWSADEQAIYAVTEKFHEYLSEGFSKDDALQKAKLSFLKKSSEKKSMPYFWANMILVGNTDPIIFSAKSSSNLNIWWWMSGGIIAIIFIIVVLKKRHTTI